MNKQVPSIITAAQVEEFKNKGVLVIPGFYDLEEDVRPIQQGIYDLIGLIIGKYQLKIQRPAFEPETFDAGFQDLIAYDRRIGGEIYDAVKQLPAFVRLVAAKKNEELLHQVRGTALAGIAGGGYGIRIDNPTEEKYRAPWHQEYPAQLRSLDGVVLWSPLVPITPELGPVEFCVGSHKGGVIRVLTRDADNPEKSGAYALRLENEAKVIASYPHISPLTRPGDLVLLDFLTLHTSGFNRGTRSRWSMQFRYFNFLDPTGVRIAWKGSFVSGVDFRDVHPELVAD